MEFEENTKNAVAPLAVILFVVNTDGLFLFYFILFLVLKVIYIPALAL